MSRQEQKKMPWHLYRASPDHTSVFAQIGPDGFFPTQKDPRLCTLPSGLLEYNPAVETRPLPLELFLCRPAQFHLRLLKHLGGGAGKAHNSLSKLPPGTR